MQTELRRLAEAHDWPAVLAISEQLATLNPAAADPDGLVTQAREALAGQQLAHRYQTARRQLADRAWDNAIDTLSAIEQEHPGYRDTAALLAEARRSVPHPTETPSPTYVPEPRILRVGQSVCALAISPDGARLATGSRQRVRMWDLRTGATAWEQRVCGWTQDVNAVAFSPDGSRLATGSTDKTARIWDAATGTPQLQVTHADAVKTVAFPDGSRLATAGGDDTARIWDASTEDQLHR